MRTAYETFKNGEDPEKVNGRRKVPCAFLTHSISRLSAAADRIDKAADHFNCGLPVSRSDKTLTLTLQAKQLQVGLPIQAIFDEWPYLSLLL